MHASCDFFLSECTTRRVSALWSDVKKIKLVDEFWRDLLSNRRGVIAHERSTEGKRYITMFAIFELTPRQRQTPHTIITWSWNQIHEQDTSQHIQKTLEAPWRRNRKIPNINIGPLLECFQNITFPIVLWPHFCSPKSVWIQKVHSYDLHTVKWSENISLLAPDKKRILL